jgi:acid stress chaperone HdeA
MIEKEAYDMSRCALIAVAMVVGVAADPMTAAAKKHHPPKMTCEEFLALSEDVQTRAVAWADGYDKAGTLKEEDVGEIDVDRQMAVLVVACKEEPKKTFWDKIRAHLPGGKKVKPTKMTCQEFVELDKSVQPEVVYWADGYNKATKVKEGVAEEVDLERDTAIIYEECKQAPKESVWAKIKKHF